ncbi:hypothetical protein [Asticcacaulis endophyticus]|uniref:Uncharacterized protein n=1 Tax=Asticcacaulis endophyticus TaxID=1395890 RepID=A0A918Q633_9CAUL|nr:hypothetical protein [Asticcacaulis endophyticus]GGZ32018.1 hypothetical protein GCM10011273_17560 [Asticcacaulis endophyticus]
MSQTFIITTAGRAALVNAANTGTNKVTITHIGVTASVFVANAAMIALPGEIKRLATFGGLVVADDIIHVTLNDESATNYTLRGFALYLSDGTLFGLFGSPTPIAEKTANSNVLMSADIGFVDVAAATIEFEGTGFLNPPATETVVGVLRLATNAEAQAGVVANAAITPKTLWFAFSAWVAAQLSDVWRASNDGSGSGMDADLLDGQHGAYFSNIPARLGYSPANKAGDTFSGPIRRDANFYADIQGDNPVISFDLNDYLYFNRVNNTYYFMIGGASRAALDASGLFQSGGQMTAAGQTVWNAGNDGSGSGSDADLLDGVQGSQFARSDVDAQHAYRAKGVPLTDPSIGTGGLWCVSATGLNVARNSTFYRVWDAGNDGAGSGLDADLLDGLQGDGYVRNNGVASAAKSAGAILAGHQALQGFGSAPIQLREVNYVGNVTNDAAYAPSIAFHWSGVAAAHLKMYADGSLRARTNNDDPGSYAPFYAATMVSNGGIVWHAANDGAGSGLDADLLDGQDGSFYTNVPARLGYTPANVADTWKPSNDGSGSGLDADLLDGYQGQYFIDLINSMFSAASNANGHVMRIGPWKIQIGIAMNVPADQKRTINFPEAFAAPPHWYNASGIGRAVFNSATEGQGEVEGTPTANQMVVCNNNSNGNPAINISWIAIAYA